MKEREIIKKIEKGRREAGLHKNVVFRILNYKTTALFLEKGFRAKLVITAFGIDHELTGKEGLFIHEKEVVTTDGFRLPFYEISDVRWVTC